jgi:restriction endonuclease
MKPDKESDYSQKTSHEIQDFHPLVAKWLSENGYEYKHEVKMREYGQADFVAQNVDGETLLIECKLWLRKGAGRAIAQVMDYCRQYGNSCKPAIAVPESAINSSVIEACKYWGVRIIALPFTIQKAKNASTGYPSSQSIPINPAAIVFADKCLCKPDEIVDAIREYHAEAGTSPLVQYHETGWDKEAMNLASKA